MLISSFCIQRLVFSLQEKKKKLKCYFSISSVSSVQLLSHVRLFATPWIAAHQASLSITNSQSLLKHVSLVVSVIQPSHPLSPPSPSAFSLSQHQGLFQWVDSSYQVAKVFELQLQHQSFQWLFRTDFFRMDRLDLHAVLCIPSLLNFLPIQVPTVY